MQETVDLSSFSNEEIPPSNIHNSNPTTTNIAVEEQIQNQCNAEDQCPDYINSEMISCEDEDVQKYYSMSMSDESYQHINKNETDDYLSEEESKALCVKYSDKSYDIMSEEYSDNSLKSRRQPLKVLRKTGIIEINRHIDVELNFMLLGDIFIHKDVFLDCRDKKMSNICPVSAFRPVIATEKTDKFCLAFVENSQLGMNDIRIPAQLLSQLNFDKAHQVSQGMMQLQHFYTSVQLLQQKVVSYYKNDRTKIEQIIHQNHQHSLVIAQQYLKRLTQDKIIMFHYKKIDPNTLTHKLHYTGSNMTMSELFTGRSDFSVMEQYMNRIGTPRYIDAEGMVNLTLAKFQGQTSFNLSLITLDDLVIPLNCSIKRIFLNEFEIIPGEKMSEYLDIHILDANLNVIQDVLAKRSTPNNLYNVSQLEYEMKAEIFLQKFYDVGNRNYEQKIYA